MLKEVQEEIYLGAVYDAMRLLGYKDSEFYINIKPKAGYSSLVHGPAFTTFGRKVSKDEDYQILDNIRLEIYKKKYFNDNPIVLLQANDDYCAHSGDITSLIYRSLGAVAFITDGNVRDMDKIDAMQFPVFCKEVNPIDALDYWALTEFNNTIEIEGVAINPGDMVYASSDGVIRVRREDYNKFCENLNSILVKETDARKMVALIATNESYSEDFSNFVNEHGRW